MLAVPRQLDEYWQSFLKGDGMCLEFDFFFYKAHSLNKGLLKGCPYSTVKMSPILSSIFIIVQLLKERWRKKLLFSGNMLNVCIFKDRLSHFFVHTVSPIIRKMKWKKKKRDFRRQAILKAWEIPHKALKSNTLFFLLICPGGGTHSTTHSQVAMHISIIVRGISLKLSRLTCVKCPGLLDIAETTQTLAVPVYGCRKTSFCRMHAAH